MHPRVLLAVLVLLVGGVLPATARPRACVPMITAPWVRMAPASMPMGAAFAVVENRCAAPVELVDVTSPDFGSVSMHETRVDGGVSRMRAVERLPLPVRARIAFRPGGLHVMLSRPLRALVPGKVVRLVFHLSDGRSIQVDAPVRDSAP